MKTRINPGRGRTPWAKGWRQMERTMAKAGSLTEKAKTRKKIKNLKTGMPWKNVIGLIGGAVGLAAFMVIGRTRGREEKRQSLAQSGQAPGRSHVQMSSHPAAQFRYQPPRPQVEVRPEQR